MGLLIVLHNSRVPQGKASSWENPVLRAANNRSIATPRNFNPSYACFAQHAYPQRSGGHPGPEACVSNDLEGNR